MDKMPTARDTTPTKKAKDEDIFEWRSLRFVDLGFTIEQAHTLSEARDHRGQLIDTHDAEKILKNGCHRDLAFEILT